MSSTNLLDPICFTRPVMRPLIGTAVRPNHITTLRLLTGIAACVAFAWGNNAGMVWGGGLWLVSAFLGTVPMASSLVWPI